MVILPSGTLELFTSKVGSLLVGVTNLLAVGVDLAATELALSGVDN